jgi:hypothetical protein
MLLISILKYLKFLLISTKKKIEKVLQDHLKYDRQELTDVWELFASDGEMKLYRREVEENGLVLDPLKAVHTVQVMNLDFKSKQFFKNNNLLRV